MSNVLLIAGGGTLGTYTAEELLRLGHTVDIICLEDNASDDPRLKYYKADATVDYLKKLFSQKPKAKPEDSVQKSDANPQLTNHGQNGKISATRNKFTC